MTDHRSPPPPAEDCLVRSYASRAVKGGTLIAEDVTDLATHERRLLTGAYRPARCEPCGAAVHIHDYRLRVLVASALVSVRVVRFRCANREACGAVFLVLPAFVARHLWREWSTVEHATRAQEATGGKPASRVPARTIDRWKARLAASAAALIVALATTSIGADLAKEVGLGGTRGEAVTAHAATAPPRGLVFASFAAVVHRTAPGIRLM